MRNRVMAAVGLASAALLACAGTAVADDGPVGVSKHNSGLLTGNVVQIPIDVQANVCGNSVNVIGWLEPSFTAICVND
ncbi:MAG TPA: chaplin [Streptomyces sp.]|nr:chaplin [Streptomyces sp.]